MIPPVRLTAAREERRLERIHDTIRTVLKVEPGDVAVVEVLTRQEDQAGFDFYAVHIRRGDQVIEVGDQLSDELDNALFDDLSAVAWRALLGEKKFGVTTIEVPGTVPDGPVGTWIKVDVDLLRAFLAKPVTSYGETTTYAYEQHDIGRAWGSPTDFSPAYGQTISDVIADLPEEVLFSTLGAEPEVDGLHGGESDVPRVRVFVRIDTHLCLSDLSKTLDRVVTSSGVGEHPEIERLIGTIVTVVQICNELIEAYMVRFHD